MNAGRSDAPSCDKGQWNCLRAFLLWASTYAAPVGCPARPVSPYTKLDKLVDGLLRRNYSVRSWILYKFEEHAGTSYPFISSEILWTRLRITQKYARLGNRKWFLSLLIHWNPCNDIWQTRYVGTERLIKILDDIWQTRYVREFC